MIRGDSDWRSRSLCSVSVFGPPSGWLSCFQRGPGVGVANLREGLSVVFPPCVPINARSVGGFLRCPTPGSQKTGRQGAALVARPAGFEPATSGLEVRCSIQLSYGRRSVEPSGRGITGGGRPRRFGRRPGRMKRPGTDGGRCRLQRAQRFAAPAGRIGRRSGKSVGAAGFEPATSCSQSRCANRTALRPGVRTSDRTPRPVAPYERHARVESDDRC